MDFRLSTIQEDQREAAKTPEQRIHSLKLLDFIQKTVMELGYSLEMHIFFVKISLRSSEVVHLLVTFHRLYIRKNYIYIR